MATWISALMHLLVLATSLVATPSIAAPRPPTSAHPADGDAAKGGRISSDDAAAIRRACVSIVSPAASYECLRRELETLRQSAGPPDLSGLPDDEAAGIRRACLWALSPAANHDCQRRELTALRRSAGRTDLSGLRDDEAIAVRRACLYSTSPATSYDCLRRELEALRRSRGRPDLSGISPDEAAGIRRACLYATSPASQYTCQRGELAALERVRQAGILAEVGALSPRPVATPTSPRSAVSVASGGTPSRAEEAMRRRVARHDVGVEEPPPRRARTSTPGNVTARPGPPEPNPVNRAPSSDRTGVPRPGQPGVASSSAPSRTSSSTVTHAPDEGEAQGAPATPGSQAVPLSRRPDAGDIIVWGAVLLVSGGSGWLWWRDSRLTRDARTQRASSAELPETPPHSPSARVDWIPLTESPSHRGHGAPMFLTVDDLVGTSDPVDGQPLRRGDTIVVCTQCRTGYHPDSWSLLQAHHHGTCVTCRASTSVRRLVLEARPPDDAGTVPCPGCAVLNRVSPDGPRALAVCGRCRRRLFADLRDTSDPPLVTVADVAAHIGELVVFEGVVQEGHPTRRGTYFLKFERGRLRDVFKVVFFPEHAERFGPAHALPRYWQRHRLRVRGVVRHHPWLGLEIVVSDPSAITVVDES